MTESKKSRLRDPLDQLAAKAGVEADKIRMLANRILEGRFSTPMTEEEKWRALIRLQAFLQAMEAVDEDEEKNNLPSD